MSKQSLTEYLKNEDLVLVDFFAEWCGPCKTMAPILSETKTKIDGKAKIIKIDIDKNQNAAQHFRVQSVPTLILFKKGAPIWRQSGVVPANQLAQLINSQ
jgi:thioredoxin 1